MRALALILAVGLVGGGMMAAPAAGQLSPQGTGNCRVGLTVTDRNGKTGTVETATGNSCWVRFADGSKDYYQQWMLKPAGRGTGAPARAAAGSSAAAASGGARGGGSIRAGNYHCTSSVSAGGAGVQATAGNMRLVFRGGGQYANHQGKSGAYTVSGSGAIAFTSGPWSGFYGQVLPDGKIGLSSRPNGRPYYMVCERR